MSNKDPKATDPKSEFEKFRDLTQWLFGVPKAEVTPPRRPAKQLRRKHYLSKSRNTVR